MNNFFDTHQKLSKKKKQEANIFATLLGASALLITFPTQAFTLNTGDLINNGPQTGDGITVTYSQSRAGTGLDTSAFASSFTTGDPFPGDTDFTFVGGFSDVNDGNAFQDVARTIPTGNTDIPLVVDVENYVNYSFSFSEPVDLTDFRVGDIDLDHDNDPGEDSFHDAIAVIVESADGTFSVISGDTSGVGSNLETYTATLVNNPDSGPDYLANGISALVPYRNNDNSNPGVPIFPPSDDSVAVTYDSSLQNVSQVNLLYWNERNTATANASDIQAIVIPSEFQVNATAVPFEFSPSMGLILSGFGFGLFRASRKKRQVSMD